jgi:hypothetical protein
MAGVAKPSLRVNPALDMQMLMGACHAILLVGCIDKTDTSGYLWPVSLYC